jgi:TPR repeat protein
MFRLLLLPSALVFVSAVATATPAAGSELPGNARAAHRNAMEALQNQDPADDAAALKTVQDLAAAGLDVAQYCLGLLYLEGKVLNQDLAAANAWWEKAAEQGYADAQYKLAHSYRVGRGVLPNPEKAYYWYLRAAQQGDVEAQLNVGNCYAYGYGVERSLNDAVLWYRRAAEGGDVPALVALATIFSSPDYAGSDPEKAYEWLLLALPYSWYYARGPQAELNGLREKLEHHLSAAQQASARQKADQWRKEHPDVNPPEVLFRVTVPAPR